jgi:hypothetical protein
MAEARLKLPKSLQGTGARVAAMAAALIGVGCVLLSVLDGWLGVLVWALTAPLVCVAIEVAFRSDAVPRKPERPRTALVFRVTRRSAPATRRGAVPPRFVWHSQSRSRRRPR